MAGCYFFADVQEILLFQNKCCCTFFDLAAGYRSAAAFRSLIHSNIPQSLIKSLISPRDNQIRTILHYAALNPNQPNILLTLLELITNIMGFSSYGKLVNYSAESRKKSSHNCKSFLNSERVFKLKY